MLKMSFKCPLFKGTFVCVPFCAFPMYSENWLDDLIILIIYVYLVTSLYRKHNGP